MGQCLQAMMKDWELYSCAVPHPGDLNSHLLTASDAGRPQRVFRCPFIPCLFLHLHLLTPTGRLWSSHLSKLLRLNCQTQLPLLSVPQHPTSVSALLTTPSPSNFLPGPSRTTCSHYSSLWHLCCTVSSSKYQGTQPLSSSLHCFRCLPRDLIILICNDNLYVDHLQIYSTASDAFPHLCPTFPTAYWTPSQAEPKTSSTAKASPFSKPKSPRSPSWIAYFY